MRKRRKTEYGGKQGGGTEISDLRCSQNRKSGGACSSLLGRGAGTSHWQN